MLINIICKNHFNLQHDWCSLVWIYETAVKSASQNSLTLLYYKYKPQAFQI